MSHIDERILAEGTTAFLTMRFVDLAGESTPPLNASYRIDDLASGVVIRSPTNLQVPPTGIITIVLDQEDNRLVNIENLREERRVSVTGQFNGGLDGSTLILNDIHQAYDYNIDRIIQTPSLPLLLKYMATVKSQLFKYFGWSS